MFRLQNIQSGSYWVDYYNFFPINCLIFLFGYKFNSYIPPIGEPDLNSAEICFKPCSKRRTLFKNKIFVFFSQSQV